jgi:F-type H+-transporting ATPase subunit gamma
MPSIKDLKKRLGTVKNTQQTTKAMKMVSAAKLRRAQDAITSQRPYAQRLGSLMRLISAMPNVPMTSPLIASVDGESGPKRLLLVLVTSDRGLCGAFNGNVIKMGQRWIAANGASYASVTLAFVGRKGYDFYRTKNYAIGTYFLEAGGGVTFQKAKKVSDALIADYLAGRFTEVKFIYNEFKNAVTQVTRVEDFLPLRPQGDGKASATGPDFIIKPSPAEVFASLLEKHFSTQTFRVMLESQAGEHGARMSAMENATKNAGEMIRKLTLQYNKQRQAGITKELLEIIAGSESQKAEA